MAQNFDTDNNPPENNNSKSFENGTDIADNATAQTAISHLKLVASNPAPVQEVPALSQPIASNAAFTVAVQEREIGFYEMNIQDSFHDLACELILEIEKNGAETAVVCHFPVILDDSHPLMDEDEILYGILMVQFQMNVLEQLFVFCAGHDASQLTIYMDDEQAKGFGILQDFLTHCDETMTEYGKKTEMLIATDQKILDKWRSFMEKTNLGLEQDLWRQQRSNPVIRSYLKSRTC